MPFSHIHLSVTCQTSAGDLLLLFYILLGCGEPMDCDSKLEPTGSPDREGCERDAGAEGGAEGMADCEGLKCGAEETDDSKKRKRKPYRPGKCHKTYDIVVDIFTIIKY